MRRPQHSTIVAYLALFVALGGTAAVALPGTNTVNSGDIKNNSVKGKDVNEKSLKGVLSCPGDMRKGSNLCFDRTLQSAAMFESALLACANRGLRLPTLGEGVMMVRHLPRDNTLHWTDVGDGDETYTALNEVGVGPNVSLEPRSTLQAYRCVTTPRD